MYIKEQDKMAERNLGIAKCFFPEVVVNGDKVKGFKPIGKRRVVERTFS